jgi:membrane protein YfhO
MNSRLVKQLLPHLIALVIFLTVSLFFCKPILEGNVLKQSDVIGWKSMAQNAFEYKAKHGHYPLWNSNLFSGMPNYQVIMEGKSVLPDMVKLMSLWLPKPINFFFLACICFYILCLSLRLRPVIGILGSLAFALATYNPIIIGVGHESKMLAIAFMPLAMAGIILTYERKYWLGLSVTTLGALMEIAVNHIQITYYFLLIALAVTVAYVVAWIKRAEWKHILISGCIVAISALVAAGSTAVSLLTTYEYAKATTRGGKDISVEGDVVKKAKTSGLDTAYAFQYSFGRAETVVLMMPKAFGEGSGKVLDENSKVVEKLADKGVPESSAIQLATQLPAYWGGILQTDGPPYLGVIICLLAIIGFVVVQRPIRWALLAITVMGILMAWGKYAPGFNTFLFTHLPMYNKFRAPSMAMVIPEFTLPIMASLALQQIFYRENSRELLKADFKKILYAVGGVLALLIIMYLMTPYTALTDNEISNNISQMAKSTEIGRAVISGMKADRRAMFGGQLLRTLGFAILLIGFLYLFMRNVIKPMVIVIALIVINTIDLFIIDKQYLNDEHFVPADEIIAQSFTPTTVEKQILQDRDPDFRVYNATVNPLYDTRSPYFFKPVTGYNPARLSIYQNLIDKYLSGSPNENVLNMLNAKYIIFTNSQTNQQQMQPNPNAFGHCWLVKNVRIVDGPVEEIQAIGSANLRDTAIVQKAFSSAATQPQWDSSASIRLTKFDNDTMDYSFTGAKPQFAVFSEIYYAKGWNAYVDGKKTEYCKADYVLRGLSLPAGQHTVRFIFEPSSYKRGVKIAYASSFLIIILVLGGFFMEWWMRREAVGSTQSAGTGNRQ